MQPARGLALWMEGPTLECSYPSRGTESRFFSSPFRRSGELPVPCAWENSILHDDEQGGGECDAVRPAGQLFLMGQLCHSPGPSRAIALTISVQECPTHRRHVLYATMGSTPPIDDLAPP